MQSHRCCQYRRLDEDFQACKASSDKCVTSGFILGQNWARLEAAVRANLPKLLKAYEHTSRNKDSNLAVTITHEDGSGGGSGPFYFRLEGDKMRDFTCVAVIGVIAWVNANKHLDAAPCIRLVKHDAPQTLMFTTHVPSDGKGSHHHPRSTITVRPAHVADA